MRLPAFFPASQVEHPLAVRGKLGQRPVSLTPSSSLTNYSDCKVNQYIWTCHEKKSFDVQIWYISMEVFYS